MSQPLSIFCLYSLLLFSATTRFYTFATQVNHVMLRSYSNATDFIQAEDLDSPFPYNFPDARAPENLFPMPDCDGVTLEEATVDQLQDAMGKGQLTSTKIVLCYMQRIFQTNAYTK